MSGLLLRRVEVEGRVVDVRVAEGRVVEVGPSLSPGPDDVVLDGEGGALVPGLHDHHIHLLATAAAERSVPVGPPEVTDVHGLARALAEAARRTPAGRWLRAVGYHESVAGDLDRHRLDALVPDHPVRLQHRTGARWTLNGAALARVGARAADRPGIERDATGEPTGRLHREDRWLRDRLDDDPPELADLFGRLTAFGVVGVTDTTPYATAAELDGLAAAVRAAGTGPRVVATGGPELAGAAAPEGLELGPVKLVVDDGDPPTLDDLAAGMATAHAHGRAAAVHCVTRAGLVLALAAWDVAGSGSGDRIEHGSVVPPELEPWIRRLGLTVVTQPGFVADRGDDYLRDVDPDDVGHLYRCAGLLAAGIPVAAGSDAPYARPDPWAAVAAATTRRTRTGAVLGPDEVVDPATALGLFLGHHLDPGRRRRRVEPGAPADLCLLDRPLAAALAAVPRNPVRRTFRVGVPAGHDPGA
ncbi:MAG: amidohydrolase family protein [Acidimicrobiia bacterium]